MSRKFGRPRITRSPPELLGRSCAGGCTIDACVICGAWCSFIHDRGWAAALLHARLSTETKKGNACMRVRSTTLRAEASGNIQCERLDIWEPSGKKGNLNDLRRFRNRRELLKWLGHLARSILKVQRRKILVQMHGPRRRMSRSTPYQ